MPIYEYQCAACGHRLEAIQKISDAPLSECPECHQASLQKLVSAPSFRLSGGGWYETDFKSDKEKKRNLAGESGTASASADSGKSETKSESKTENKKESNSAAKPATDSKPKASKPSATT